MVNITASKGGHHLTQYFHVRTLAQRDRVKLLQSSTKDPMVSMEKGRIEGIKQGGEKDQTTRNRGALLLRAWLRSRLYWLDKQDRIERIWS